MLKFLRKYQKWMLVIFCGGLMVAFLVPQAAQQFMPDPMKATMARTADGKEINREQLQRTARDLQTMRRLLFDPVNLPGLMLLPNTGSDADDAMMWILIQHAAKNSGLGASDTEAFNLAATALGVETQDEMDKRAAELNIASADGSIYLMRLAREYLIAEQYRQLVMGTEFSKPTGTAGETTGSPGLRRFTAAMEARQAVAQLANNPQLPMFAQMMNMSVDQLIYAELEAQGVFENVIGHERVTADQVQYLMQQQLTELDLTVVVLDAEDREAAVTVDDAYVTALFERFADDAPGQGRPYGLGYRVPNRVKLEALRIPVEQVRAQVASEITAEDVRSFYDERPFDYIDTTPVEEGETPRPRRLTALQREEIKLTLTQMRTEERVSEIAEQARLRLNEDARGLEDDGSFKALPEDFVPTPMDAVAAWIAEEYAIDAEPIVIDEWVSGEQMRDEQVFTATWLSQMPGSTVRVPGQSFGMTDQQVPATVLSGRAGLFASLQIDLSQQAGQPFSLAQYVSLAKPFVEPESDAAQVGLQVGLPGRVVSDLTRSAYVFRLTGADPAHRATDPTPIMDQLRQDALKVKAYESLLEDKDALIGRAAETSIESLMADADAKQTLSALTRRMLGTTAGLPRIDGITSTRPIVEQAFERVEQQVGSAGLDDVAIADRVFAVELPGDYKLAVVRLDAFRPLTRRDFERYVAEGGGGVLFTASRIGVTEPPEPAWTLDALIRYTGLKWADGFGPDDLREDEDADTDEE